MEFYNYIHCKYAGIKGFLTVYHDALRYAYMITPKALDKADHIDYHESDLIETDIFNRKLIDWLVWYNTERPRYAFQNQLSPVQFIISLPNQFVKLPQERKSGRPHTFC